jgi:hypothetical protein
VSLIRSTSQRRAAALPAAIAVGLLAAGCGGSDSTGGVVQNPGTVTLLDVQAQVFSPRCALSGCHTGTGAPFGLDLGSAVSSSANLVGVASAEIPGLMRVEPGNAADSYLYMKITDDPRIQGDPMPLSGVPLSSAELSLIETWITEGAM